MPAGMVFRHLTMVMIMATQWASFINVAGWARAVAVRVGLDRCGVGTGANGHVVPTIFQYCEYHLSFLSACATEGWLQF